MWLRRLRPVRASVALHWRTQNSGCLLQGTVPLLNAQRRKSSAIPSGWEHSLPASDRVRLMEHATPVITPLSFSSKDSSRVRGSAGRGEQALANGVLRASQSRSPFASHSAAESHGREGPPRPLENLLHRLFTSWQQGLVSSLGAVMGIGFLVYLLYVPVKEDTVHHTALVASEALRSAQLRAQVLQLSKNVVDGVVNDPKSLDLTVALVVKLLAQEDVKVAVSSLLQSLFEDHYTQEMTKKFVLMIVRDPWIQDQLQSTAKDLTLQLLQDQEVKQALSNFFAQSATDSLRKPEVHYEAARAVRKSIMRLVNPWLH